MESLYLYLIKFVLAHFASSADFSVNIVNKLAS